MSYIALLVYFVICGAAYCLFRYLYKNRYNTYYSVDEILDTDESNYVTYSPEEQYSNYISSYSVYITDDFRFFKVNLRNNVEYINFDLICYKNKKIYKVCNVLNEVRDKKEDFTLKIPDNCDEVKVRINEVNGKVFVNQEILKGNLLWRAIVSSLVCGVLSVGLIFLYRLLFLPSVNNYFHWEHLFSVLFSEPFNYVFGALLSVVMTFSIFSILYFPNLLKVKRAKFNKVKKFKISKIIKCKFKPNKKREKQIINLKIKGHKKFRTGLVHVLGYDEEDNLTLDKTFGVKNKKKSYLVKTNGYVSRIEYEVISADFKKYYYEFKKFRIKQTKKGLEGKFLRLKGIGIATLIFTLSIGITTGSAIYEFTKIYQINNNMKHFVFEENGDSSYSITGYRGKNNVIAIPTFYQNKEVRVIENAAFASNQYIVETIFPDNIQIGDAAFANCKWLKSAEFGKGTNIGSSAFFGTHLRKVHFKDNEVIGDGAFANIVTLREVKLEGNITLGDGVFKNSKIGYLEVHPNSFNLPTSTFYGAKVEKGYIFEGSGFTASNISSLFAPNSNVKAQNSCVHDKYSFMVKKGQIIDNYSYKDFAVIQEATCTARGVKEVECNYCSAHYYVTTKLNPNNHNYLDGYCVNCGKKDPNFVEPEVPDVEEGGKENVN